MIREMTDASATGEWEHVIMSYVTRLIPESVKTKWHEYKESVKQAERQMTGKQNVTDHVEMAGWGVEEARERNKKDASKYSHFLMSSLSQIKEHN
jgi:N-terminal acetyltransferase 2